MQSYVPVSSKRVLKYLAERGCAFEGDARDVDIFPVSFRNRRNCTTFFVSDPEILTETANLNNCIIFGPQVALENQGGEMIYVPCENPRSIFFDLVSNLFLKKSEMNEIHPSASIDPSSKIGDRVGIGENVVIGAGCTIGDGTEIRAEVVIHNNVSIGSDCLIKSGCVIGQEGFGLYESGDGVNVLIPHLGGVVIGDRVLIGALNTICSGTLDPTMVGDDTKLDDHVHVAHNCIIGKNVIITACAELSGSVVLEDGVWVGPQASIMNKITIGEGAFIGLGAVVTKGVSANRVVAGNPARIIR